ncbi:MAG: trypsin-like peptidase domain-containing protein [Proteobacteria bacterium]|nr:trypsin-like peptidase domain-containing protein [Pseudomonadota bacterium]
MAAALLASAAMLAPAATLGLGAALAPAPARAAGSLIDVSGLVPRLLPAVVNISTRQLIDPGAANGGKVSTQSARTRQSLGSGFIIDPGGVIVTNNHVIADAYDITVTLQDNQELKATLVATSTVADLAVLKVNAGKPLPSVSFGDSTKLKVGQPVIAIGNPLGLGGSVSGGIVSALNRDLMSSPYDDYIQTDAAINHGNSGGPLFNLDGEVIGVNTAIFSPLPEGGSIGLGFAIPAENVQFVVGQLRQYGRVHAGFLGAHIQQVTSDIARAVGLPNIMGAIVDDVLPGGPAAKAGLQSGDVILRVGDDTISDTRAVARAVGVAPIGKPAELVVWRNNQAVTLTVMVSEWPGDLRAEGPGVPPPPAPQPAAAVDMGLHFAPINDEARRKYKLAKGQKGVVVTSVAPLSVAYDRGLLPGNVIEQVQMQPVNSLADLHERVSAARAKGAEYVMLLVRDSDGLRWVAMPMTGLHDGEQKATQGG